MRLYLVVSLGWVACVGCAGGKVEPAAGRERVTLEWVEFVHGGTIADGDQVFAEDGSLYDSHAVTVEAGWRIAVAMESNDFIPFLMLTDSSDAVVARSSGADEPDGDTDLSYRAPADGTYIILANTLQPGGRGAYTLSVTAGP